MSRLNQVREEMRLTKDPAAQRSDRAPGADISQKLQKIIADINECGHASVTRLTVLKKGLKYRTASHLLAYLLPNRPSSRWGKRRRRQWSFCTRRVRCWPMLMSLI